MKLALQTLLQLRDEGTLAGFALGGAVAASFYAEAVATEDLDVFAFMAPSHGGLLVLTPLYDRLKALGGVVRAEHVVIGSWPVQILPAYTPLVEEAITHARLQEFAGLRVPVVDAEHLCAIALQTGRAKDFARVHSLIGANAVDMARLKSIIEAHALIERWNSYVKRYA
jgi:hypothetical protein